MEVRSLSAYESQIQKIMGVEKIESLEYCLYARYLCSQPLGQARDNRVAGIQEYCWNFEYDRLCNITQSDIVQ